MKKNLKLIVSPQQFTTVSAAYLRLDLWPPLNLTISQGTSSNYRKNKVSKSSPFPPNHHKPHFFTHSKLRKYLKGNGILKKIRCYLIFPTFYGVFREDTRQKREKSIFPSSTILIYSWPHKSIATYQEKDCCKCYMS